MTQLCHFLNGMRFEMGQVCKLSLEAPRTPTQHPSTSQPPSNTPPQHVQLHHRHHHNHLMEFEATNAPFRPAGAGAGAVDAALPGKSLSLCTHTSAGTQLAPGTTTTSKHTLLCCFRSLRWRHPNNNSRRTRATPTPPTATATRHDAGRCV